MRGLPLYFVIGGQAGMPILLALYLPSPKVIDECRLFCAVTALAGSAKVPPEGSPPVLRLPHACLMTSDLYSSNCPVSKENRGENRGENVFVSGDMVPMVRICVSAPDALTLMPTNSAIAQSAIAGSPMTIFYLRHMPSMTVIRSVFTSASPEWMA
jgi:hypothetical protein